MKRRSLLFMLCLLFAGQSLYAQWYFDYMCGLGNLQRQGGYATKSACEAAATAMEGSQCNGNGWGSTIKIPRKADNCACSGSDLPVVGTSNNGQPTFGSADFDNTQKGKGIVTTNPYDDLIDAKDEYLYREKVMYLNGKPFSGGMQFPATRDAEYNLALQMIYPRKTDGKWGRPGSAEGIFNYLINPSEYRYSFDKSQQNNSDGKFKQGRSGETGGFTTQPQRGTPKYTSSQRFVNATGSSEIKGIADDQPDNKTRYNTNEKETKQAAKTSNKLHKMPEGPSEKQIKDDINNDKKPTQGTFEDTQDKKTGKWQPDYIDDKKKAEKFRENAEKVGLQIVKVLDDKIKNKGTDKQKENNGKKQEANKKENTPEENKEDLMKSLNNK